MANREVIVQHEGASYAVTFVEMVRGVHHPEGVPMWVHKWCAGGRFAPHWRAVWDGDRSLTKMARAVIEKAQEAGA